MRSLIQLATLFALLFATPSPSLSSRAQTEKERGSISGHVKVDDKPAQGITVIAVPSIADASKAIESMFNKPASIKATTDSDGRYRFEDIPAGRYRVVPFAPTLVNEGIEHGSEVTVTGGSQTENVDFAMLPGGVITGRVTDGDGRPVIGEGISLKPVDGATPSAPQGAAFMMSIAGGSGRMYATDDRGVYRIFGLRPGRYLVSAGSDANPFYALLKSQPKRTQTFYPGVTDQTKAKTVQVTAGSEASGIDIQFASGDRGFAVSGRVVEGTKGTPIANAMVAYSKVRPVSSGQTDVDERDDVAIVDFPGGFTTTNDKGEFKFESVTPGSYELEVAPMGALTGSGANDFYADRLPFEVRASSLDRIEVRVHRGASISGVVIAEDADGKTVLEGFGEVMVFVAIFDPQTKSNSSGTGMAASDGSFRIGGLKPGKATIRISSRGGQQLAMMRLERNGVDVQGTLDVQANEQLSGLRIVVTPANCVIRGHVSIQNGPLPRDAILAATVRPQNADASDFSGHKSADVDSNGDFIVEDLAPGDYLVEAYVVVPSGKAALKVSAIQTVNTSRGVPALVNLVLDLAGKGSDK